MKKIFIFIGLTLLASWGLYHYHPPLQHFILERFLNFEGREFFAGSLRLNRGTIDRHSRVAIQGIHGILQNGGKSVRLEMASMTSDKLIPNLFTRGTVMEFHGIRPQGSKNPGVQIRTEVKAGPHWSHHSVLTIEKLDLSEIQWLNPDNLQGSSGDFGGSIEFQADAENPTSQFHGVLLAAKGGTLQARFFEVLLPYLPAMPTRDQLAKIAAAGKLVLFKDAALRFELANARRMKVALHILIPDYNVELNINLEVRLEEQTSFPELARVLGFVKVQS